MDSDQLWQTALGQLELQLPRPTFDTWVKETESLSFEDGVLVVCVPSAYTKDWLENRLYGDIQKTVSGIAKRTVAVRFVVQRNKRPQMQQEPEELLEGNAKRTQTRASGGYDREDARINPKYTFDAFVIGQSNRLAQAGCLAVAENPGLSYNPLFIYGGVGLGKTHLLHAIGNRALQDERRTLYVSTETFANEMINAIRKRTTDEFRARYRTIELLLLDDIQFLINKEATQEEFFHTFNDLYQSNRQIVLCSDRPPQAFVGLEERLRSRFEWGLTADIQAPDLETRMAILVTKAEERGAHLPPEVVEFVAQQVQHNIRELEGALTRVLASARMLGEPLSVQTAQRALGDRIQPKTKLEAQDILTMVASYYELEVTDLTGRRRTRDIAFARQVAMYLTRNLTSLSFPKIGEAIGGRDHSTVMHGHDKISALFEKDDDVRGQILEIKTELYGGQRRPAAQGERIGSR